MWWSVNTFQILPLDNWLTQPKRVLDTWFPPPPTTMYPYESDTNQIESISIIGLFFGVLIRWQAASSKKKQPYAYIISYIYFLNICKSKLSWLTYEAGGHEQLISWHVLLNRGLFIYSTTNRKTIQIIFYKLRQASSWSLIIIWSWHMTGKLNLVYKA